MVPCLKVTALAQAGYSAGDVAEEEEARAAPGGRLVCALHGMGTERRTGLTTDMHYGAAFAFAPDGRLVEIHEYATHREALEAVGLSE